MCVILNLQLYASFSVVFYIGEVSEWLKEHAWKACVGVKTHRGFESPSLRQFCVFPGPDKLDNKLLNIIELAPCVR